MRSRIWTMVLAAAMCGAACGSNATIKRLDGTELEGRIVGGTPLHVLVMPVESTAGAGPDEVLSVRRGAISDIDHPGNVAMVGLGILGLGCLPLTVGGMQIVLDGRFGSGSGSRISSPYTRILGAGVVILATLPLMFATRSGVEWWGSRSRARSPDSLVKARPGVGISPGGLIIRF